MPPQRRNDRNVDTALICRDPTGTQRHVQFGQPAAPAIGTDAYYRAAPLIGEASARLAVADRSFPSTRARRSGVG